MKILVENSTWNNVGDGFYQSTLYVLLKQLYPNDTVVMGDGPMIRAFRPKSKKHSDNMFHMMSYQHADVHIFSGPIMNRFFDYYAEKIMDIRARGNNYAFISVSSAHTPDKMLREIGEFLIKYPPLFLASRDQETFHNMKSYVKNSYNGICTAFLVNKMLPVDEIEHESPYFISSFYTELEPFYKADGDVTIENLILERKASYFNLNHKYTRHLNFLRPQQATVKDHKIVRVHQELSTHFYHIKFSHPNSFMSFNPLSYLALYKSAEFTISDRVHSCAVSLAFGKPARLFTKSPRAGIFERLGYKYEKSGDIIRPIDSQIIDEETLKLMAKIKEYL